MEKTRVIFMSLIPNSTSIRTPPIPMTIERIGKMPETPAATAETGNSIPG